MNENTENGRIKSATGIDCVIAWLESICEDDPYRKIKASAVRQHPPVGNGFWEITIELDDKKLGDMSLYREGNTYARGICRALVASVGGQATHAARNRKKRKARRDAEREAVEITGAIQGDRREAPIDDVFAKLREMHGTVQRCALVDPHLEYEAVKVLECSQSFVSAEALRNEVSFRIEQHITEDELGFTMCKLEKLGLVARFNTAFNREVWAITDKGRQALKDEIYAHNIKVNI